MTWLIVACLVVLLGVLGASLWTLQVFRRLAKAVDGARGKTRSDKGMRIVSVDGAHEAPRRQGE